MTTEIYLNDLNYSDLKQALDYAACTVVDNNKMFKVYKNLWDNSIHEYLVIRTTDSSVWYSWEHGSSTRELKNTNDHAWFDTKEEAYRCIENKIIAEIRWKEREISSLRNNLEKFHENYKDIKREILLDDILR